jgi:hypothetical protein
MFFRNSGFVSAQESTAKFETKFQITKTVRALWPDLADDSRFVNSDAHPGSTIAA